MFDLERLLEPVAGDAPVGPDLRDETDFRDLEEAPAAFATQKAAELRQVVAQCDAMLQRTKDHLPAIVALQAAMRMGDLALANATLAVIRGLAETYWEDFHPGPAEDMVIARVNELTSLARPAAIVLPLERMNLVSLPAPSTQGFTAAMLGMASVPVPEWSAEDQETLSAQLDAGQISATAAKAEQPMREGARALRAIMGTLSRAARDADREAGIEPADLPVTPDVALALAGTLRDEAQRSRDALAALSDGFYDLNALYDTRAGESASLGPVLSALRSSIDSSDRFLSAFAPEAEPAFEDGAVDVSEEAGGEPGGGGGPRAGRFVPSVPQSRDDVLRAIDSISTYYREREPTSPVPLMLDRLRNWVTMDFLELLNEIAPGSIHEAQGLLASRQE